MSKFHIDILSAAVLFSVCLTNAQTGPPPPAFIAPVNLATGIRVNATFAWTPRSQATSYDLQLSKDSAFSVLDINYSGLTCTTICLDSLSHGATYFWRVRSVNAQGPGPYSQASRFRTRVSSAIEGDGIMSSFGATILRHAADIQLLTGDALEWGDVTGDGTASAYDAAIVLQAAAGLLSEYSAYTLIDNFGPGWDYDTGFGWSISGKYGGNTNTYEQAMAFTASRSGVLKDIWVALSHSPMYKANEVHLMFASDLAGMPGDVLETWTLRNIGEWDLKNPPHHVTGSGNTLIYAGAQYWLWVTCDDSTFAMWNMVTDHNGLCLHTLKRGLDWLPSYYETASVFRVDIMSDANK